MAPDALGQLEAWFVCGSQHMYGAEQLRSRRGARGRDRRRARRRRRDPGARRRQAGRDDPGVDPGRARRGQREPELHRRDRVDAHVLAGEDVDLGARRPPAALPAPAHAVQPRSPLGGDRHGLHEPEPVRARRPGVRVHGDPDGPRAEDRRRPLERAGRARADRRLDEGRRRLARGAQPHRGAVRGQHAPGRGDRGRQGRGAAPARRDRVGLRRRRPRRVGERGLRRRGRPAGRRVRGGLRPRPRASRGRRAARVPPRRGADRGRAAGASSSGSAPARSPTPSRTSTG